MFIDKFEKQSKEQNKKKWLETTTKFLKGKPYQELEWEFSEGISIEPYYTKDKIENTDVSYLEVLQNSQMALNDPVSKPRFWYNQPLIEVDSLEKSNLENINKEIRQVLMSGAEGVLLDLRNVEITNFDEKSFEYLLFEVALPYCAVSFKIDATADSLGQDFSRKYIAYAQRKGFDSNLLTGGILCNEGMKISEKILNLNTDTDIQSRFNFISLYLNNKNKGKEQQNDEAQNIAAILFEVKKIVDNSNKFVVQNIQFVVEATDSFFVTIAKIRALRWLLIQMYDLYEVNHKPYIHSITSKGTDERSLNDENWNLIRNTTQSFACILGGTNAITVTSHQAKDVEKSISMIWSDRIARNISLILREESFVDATADPISGSYYCRQMTDKLIESAWEKFQKLIY